MYLCNCWVLCYGLVWYEPLTFLRYILKSSFSNSSKLLKPDAWWHFWCRPHTRAVASAVTTTDRQVMKDRIVLWPSPSGWQHHEGWGACSAPAWWPLWCTQHPRAEAQRQLLLAPPIGRISRNAWCFDSKSVKEMQEIDPLNSRAFQ